MGIVKISQLLPGFGAGDAISNFALELQKIIRSWGIESSIYCNLRHVGPTEEHLVEDHRRLTGTTSQEDIAIYHYSVASDLTPVFGRIPGRKILVYHNITPAEYFAGIDERKAAGLEEGRRELTSLTDVCDLALGVSEYNRAELERIGFKRTGVLPLILDPIKLSAEPDHGFMKQYGDGTINIFHAGRTAPNKKIDDLIKIFYFYHRTINPNSRLLLAGSLMGVNRYTSYLRTLITMLDLDNVVFFNHVSGAQLNALYRSSHLFLNMSEHEGFCMPLLEAMYFKLPVIAYGAAAIPETLGGCGVMVKEKDPAAIAELIDRVLGDPALKAEIIRRQLTRPKAFYPAAVAEKLRKILLDRHWIK